MDGKDEREGTGPQGWLPHPGPVSERAQVEEPADDPRKRTAVPLLDPGVLEDLEAEVPGAATRFARAFIGLWEQRHARIADAVHAGDRTAALEAALSLKASAMMVGATLLAELAAELARSLSRRDGNQVHLCDRVGACGAETMEVLRAQPLVAAHSSWTSTPADQASE